MDIEFSFIRFRVIIDKGTSKLRKWTEIIVQEGYYLANF